MSRPSVVVSLAMLFAAPVLERLRLAIARPPIARQIGRIVARIMVRA